MHTKEHSQARQQTLENGVEKRKFTNLHTAVMEIISFATKRRENFIEIAIIHRHLANWTNFADVLWQRSVQIQVRV